MMTPSQKLKHMILNRRAEWEGAPPVEATAETIDELYEQAESNDDGSLQDARNDVRCGQVETEVESPWSRHYEAKSVAAQAPDGSWIGWTYWYGGGKHGEPEAVDWIPHAYALTCTEEEKVVVVRNFAKV